MSATQKDEKTIFKAVVVLKTPAERTAYLDKVCADNPALKARIMALLQAHDDKGDFIEALVEDSGVSMDDQDLKEKPGTVIGRYKLLEKIGEGGMAVVYMAEQEKPIRRKVALKIIKLGMDTKQVIARFEAERQALAMMDHPNIAKVLDAGATETGRPYFVMELVKGVSLTEYCDGSELSTRERLDLFLQVCNAVQHAHQKGIIHRDIKPSNVMVTQRDGTPVPKVIDFGIAKATSRRLTEKTLFTRYAHIIGTPAYMSPEQAELSELDVDTRSDIYSLGVLLYELLTGTTPFSEEELRKAGYLKMQRIILEEEPAKPSTMLSTLGETLTDVAKHHGSTPDLLQKAIRGDLDWIVMKSLEKDRTGRYDTATGLAADIKRHLNSEPVLAAAPSASYRLRKFIRRNRVAVMVGCLVVLLVLLALAALSVSTVLVWREKIRTEGQRQRAKTNLSLALEALDKIYVTMADKQLPQEPQIAQADRQLLQEALMFYERFAAENKTAIESRNETARAYLRVGGIQEILDQYVGAEQAYLQAVSLFEELVAEYPTIPQYQSDLISALRGLGAIWHDTARHRKLVEFNRRKIDLCEKLVADFPDVPEYRYQLAESYHGLSWAFEVTGGRQQEAIRFGQDAIETLEDLVIRHPDVHAYRRSLARYRINLGQFLNSSRQYSEAEKPIREGIASYEKLASEFPDVGEYKRKPPWGYATLAAILYNMGQLEEAEQAFRRSIELREKVVAEFPSMPDQRLQLARAYRWLGVLLWRTSRTDEAKDIWQRALQIGEKLVAENPSISDTGSSPGTFLSELAVLLEWQGKHEQACQLLEKYITRQQVAAEGDYPPFYLPLFVRNSYMNLARIQKYLNETDKAKESLHQAIELSRGLVQETPEPSVDEHCLAQCLHQLTLLLLQDTGQLEAAERHCLEAVKLYEKLADEAPSAPESRWGLAMAYTSFGNLLRKTGRTDEAAKCHLQALKLYEKLVVEFPTNHNYQNGMAWFLVTCSDPQFHDAARAVQLARKATELVPKVALPWNTLGVAHYRAGHWEEAIESLLKSTELSSGGSSYSSHDFFFLAMAHWQLGNTEEARQWYDKAVEWMEQNKPEDVELRRFRVEAEALLSISDAPMPNGKEVIPEQIE